MSQKQNHRYVYGLHANYTTKHSASYYTIDWEILFVELWCHYHTHYYVVSQCTKFRAIFAASAVSVPKQALRWFFPGFGKMSVYTLSCILQFSSILTASLYELQIVSLTVTNPFHKSGFFKISLNESGDKEFLSSLAISDIETYMIPSSSLQKSKTAYIAYYVLKCAFSINFQEVTIRCICLNWPIKAQSS